MKKKQTILIGMAAMLVIIALSLTALSLTGCDPDKDKDGGEDPVVPQPKTITQADGLAFAGKVTISSPDKHTPSAWDDIVSKVVDALNRGYNKDLGNPIATNVNKTNFESVFWASKNAEVIVLKSASNNIEVKAGEYNKLYIKESSLDTVDTSSAVIDMKDSRPHQAKGSATVSVTEFA